MHSVLVICVTYHSYPPGPLHTETCDMPLLASTVPTYPPTLGT